MGNRFEILVVYSSLLCPRYEPFGFFHQQVEYAVSESSNDSLALMQEFAVVVITLGI